jgi:hypothetical protein
MLSIGSRILSVSLVLALFPAVRAQVRLARVSGAPGRLTNAATVVLQPSGNLGYVTNPGSGLVEKFRTITGETVGSTPLPQGIGPATLSPDSRTLAVLGVTSQRLYLINTATMTLRNEGGYTRSGFTERSNILFSQDGSRIFVADPSRDHVAVFNASDATVVRFLAVGIAPNIMSFFPDGRSAAVLCSGRQSGDPESVYVIDTLNVVVSDFGLFAGQNAEAFNNVQFALERNILFVPGYNDNRITVFDLRSGSVGSRSSYGRGPSKILTSPDGRWLAVLNVLSKNVVVLSLPEALLAREISIPDLDLTVDSTPAFSSDSRTLFIPSVATGELIAYDIENSSIRRRVRVGDRPVSLVSNRESATVASLDVGSNEVSIVALSPNAFYIPHLVQSPNEFSGIALANFGPEVVNIALIARSNSGSLLPGTTNPRLLTVTPGNQTSLVVGQIFGFNPTQTLDGWIEAYTLGSAVSALYLFGNNSQTQLDGFVADAVTSRVLGFSRITELAPRFGSQTATEIVVINPNEAPAEVVFRLYGATSQGPGSVIASATLVLNPRSRLSSRVSSLMPLVVYPLEKGYLEVTSNLPVQGLEVVKIGDSTAMIAAKVRGITETQFYSAQFATGGSGVFESPIFSSLSLCNTSPAPITITVRVAGDGGQTIPADSMPMVRTLQPYETLAGGSDEILDFPNPLSSPALYVGSLTVTADGPGLIGDLLFGDARNGKYLTAYSLQQRAGTRSYFAHFAEGLFGDPPRGLFTGLAFYNNTRDQVAEILVEAYSPQNLPIGRADFTLAAGRRLSRTLSELIPSITQQNGGTVRVTSTVPLLVFQVFGSSESLVAVPPLILP